MPPLVRSVGVGLWHGGLWELTCCVWRSISRFGGLYSSICRSGERVSLEVECASSEREVELIALGDAELGGAEYVFEWLIRA